MKIKWFLQGFVLGVLSALIIILFLNPYQEKRNSNFTEKPDAISAKKGEVVSFAEDKGPAIIGEYYDNNIWTKFVEADVLDRHGGEIKIHISEECWPDDGMVSCFDSYLTWIKEQNVIFYSELDPFQKAIKEKKTEIEWAEARRGIIEW